MKHIISIGHTASGNLGCGAVGKLNESNCTREIGPAVADYIKNVGEDAVLLRIDKSNSYNYEDCYLRAAQANEIDGDTFTEIHINAGGAGATGVEVLLNSMNSKMKPYAEKVCENISKALNITNRGVKVQSLIVLKRTSMPAMLVECCFVDSPDAEKYNPNIIAKAIADGLVGAACTTRKLGWNKNNVGWWYCTNVEKGYYYTSNNGWKYIDGEWYIFDDNGYALESAWYKDGNTWYYLDESCKMVHATSGNILWKWIDDACYAFDGHGKMYCNCTTTDGYKVDDNGAWIK